MPAAGLKISPKPNFSSVCNVVFDSAVPCIAVLWKCYVTSPQLREVHEHILQLLRVHQVHFILGDDTALPVILAEDQRWIAQDWMPRAQAVGLKAIASKRSSSYFGQLSVQCVQSIAPAGLAFRSFDKMEDGRAWLRSVCPT